MKKEKTNSRQSKKNEKKAAEKKAKAEKKSIIDAEEERPKGPKILVPLLSKRESEEEFVATVAPGAGEIILLLVIDTHAMVGGFGFAAGEIAVGNALMQKVKTAFGKKRKTCNDIIEWGDTANKIEHLAELNQVAKIFVVKQDNDFFKKLLKDMKEKLPEIEIQEIELPKAE